MVKLIASNQLTLTNLNEKAIDRTEISFWHGLSATKYPLGVYDCGNRDHQYGNEFNVTSGKTYTVRVIAKQTKGSIQLRGGIWYTAMTSGNSRDGFGDFTLVGEASEDGIGVYERKLVVASGKTKAKIFIQIEQGYSDGFTAWRIYDGQVLDENGQLLVTDQNNYGALASPMATPNGTYIWKRTITYYTDGTSNTIWEYSGVGANGKDGIAGKVVSDTEPISLFKGLTWKYSGTANLTASDGTVINPNTEYFYNGTHWVINYFSVNNFASESITSDKINGKNLTITNGEFISNTTNGPVAISTEIKDNYIAISKTDTSINTVNSISLDPEQGLGMGYLNRSTGYNRGAGINFQGLFTNDNAGNYAQLTPQGTKLSTDVPWTKLSLMNNFNGSIEYAIINGTVYISASGVGVPAMSAGQWKQAAQLPTGSLAIPVRANRIAAGDSGDGLSWALLSNQAGGLFIRCSGNKPATANLFNATLPYPIG